LGFAAPALRVWLGEGHGRAIEGLNASISEKSRNEFPRGNTEEGTQRAGGKLGPGIPRKRKVVQRHLAVKPYFTLDYISQSTKERETYR